MPRRTHIDRRLAIFLAFPALLSGCGGSDTPVIVQASCAVDTIDGATGTPPSASAGTELLLKGWAADTMGRRVTKEVYLRLVSASGAVVATGKKSGEVNRPDVAKHFKMVEIEPSGFHATVGTNGLAAGNYEIMIESRFDSAIVACRPGRTVTIR